MEDYASAIDDKPRSRKPIAYNLDELDNTNSVYDSSVHYDGPPPYQTHPDNSMYGADYSTMTGTQRAMDYGNSDTIPRQYGANYGAAC